MQPFLAMIVPMGQAPGGGGGPVDPGYSPPWAQAPGGGQRPPGVPTHPIMLPGMPGFGDPRPDQGLPGNQPYPDNSLPGQQPRPDQSLPPFPMLPIYIPIYPPEDAPHPEHPIYIPIVPTHPIVIPPGTPPEEIYNQIKAKLEFIFGNLPTDPNEKPTPV